MVEKNLKKLKTKKRRVMNGFNTGTRDMKLKTAYQRKRDGRQKMPIILLKLFANIYRCIPFNEQISYLV